MWFIEVRNCLVTQSEWDPSMLTLIFLLTFWTLIFKKQKLFPHKNVTVDIWFIYNADWILAILLINLVTTALLWQASIQSPTSVQCISLPVSHETAGFSCSVGGELNPGWVGLCLLFNLTENPQFLSLYHVSSSVDNITLMIIPFSWQGVFNILSAFLSAFLALLTPLQSNYTPQGTWPRNLLSPDACHAPLITSPCPYMIVSLAWSHDWVPLTS